MATGIVAAYSPVNFGPSTTLYPSQGSAVGPNETVTILWREGGWYYVEYLIGNTKIRKRMFIPTTKLSKINGSVPFRTLSSTAILSSPTTTYTGPSTRYQAAGPAENESLIAYNEVSKAIPSLNTIFQEGKRKEPM